MDTGNDCNIQTLCLQGAAPAPVFHPLSPNAFQQ